MHAIRIIDLLGGYRIVAKELGLGLSTVNMWRRNGIPADRCVELEKLARATQGRLGHVTLAVLLKSTPRTASVGGKPAPARKKVADAPTKMKRTPAVK